MASRSHAGRRAAAAPASRGGDRLAKLRGSRVARALIAHEHWTAAALLALLVLAYLWPALVGGKVLAPTSLLYDTTPWRASAEAGIQHEINNELGDAVFLYYPWDVLVRQLLHAGTFPAWNPYAFAGTPLFANFQIAWLSPFSLPLWILPLHYGLGVAAALKLWLAGFGSYLLVRELKLGFWPGMLAGVGFALCAFNVVWLSHGVFVSVACLLPWALWLVERLLRRGRPADGLALGGVIALIETGGHPGTQLHVLTATVLYALLRTALMADVERRERVRRIGLVAAAVLVGTLLSAVALVPAQHATVDATGVFTRKHQAGIFPGANMPFSVTRTALFPEWWGRPSERVAAFSPANFRERTFYAGTVSLVLALVGLLARGGWERKAPFALLAALGVAVAVRTPLQALVLGLPLFDGVQNQRIVLWFVFAVPVLAAFGLQAVLDGSARRRAWAAVAVALAAAFAAALTLHASGEALREALHYFRDRSGGLYPETLALASIGWWTVFVVALAATLVLARRRPAIAAPLVAVAAALDLLHFAHGYQKMAPSSAAVVPRPTPAVVYLQRHAGSGRIAALGKALPADFTTVYGLHDVRGRDVPQPTFRFFELWTRIGPPGNEPGEIVAIGRSAPKALGLLGMRYLLVDPEVRVTLRGMRPVYRGDDATIYGDALALPRALVVLRVHIADGLRREARAAMARSFDPRRDVVLRHDQVGGLALPRAGARGAVHVTAERNASVTLRATLARRGVVVLDDAWAPGWSVTVDGRPARALTADVVLRGVAVPAGSHTIVWRYRVPGLRAGALLSGLGMLAMLGWGGALVVAARRRPRGRR